MISHDEKMASLPPERRVRSEARTEAALKEIRAIRELRSLLGLTQEEFAEKVGVSQSRISRLENGSRGLTFEWIRDMATLFYSVIANEVYPELRLRLL